MVDQRKKVFWAGAGSLGIHVLLLFLWAWTVQWSPRERTPPPDVPEPEPIKVTIEEEKSTPPLNLAALPTPTPTPPPVRFMDSSDMLAVTTPPPDTTVESAQNTVAASEMPPEGDRAGPTQRGRVVPRFVVNTQETRAADEGRASEAPANTPPPPPPETAPPLPRAVAAQPVDPFQSLAAAPVAATPPPAKPADFALSEPKSLPTQPPTEANPYDPSFRPPVSLTEPPRPTPVLASRRGGGYQPQQLKTAAKGRVTNQGPTSIASKATPLGRYQALVIESIGRRYYAYLGQRTDLASMGSVKIRFLVGLDGKARSTQVVANTANEALASISLQAILDAKVPPMPADIVPPGEGGQLPMEISFEFLDSSRF